MASARMGVKAIEGWAKLTVDQKNKVGWPNVFTNVELFNTLTKIHGLIEFVNSPGGAHRTAYAEFLEEASEVLNNSSLRKTAILYRELGQKWTNLANTALPNSIPLFKKAREAALEWNSIFISKGQTYLKEVQKASEKVNNIHVEIMEDYPLTKTEELTHLEEMSKKLLEIYQDEVKALNSLKSAV